MIDLATLTRFIMQLGLAVTGAASVWLILIYYRIKKNKDLLSVFHLQKLSDFLISLFTVGLTVFTASWLILKNVFYQTEALAHEGINIKPSLDFIQNGFRETTPLVFLLVAFSLLLFYFLKYKTNLFKKLRIIILASCFLLVSLIDASILSSGSWDKVQAFYFLHHFHSIFTIGTVITLDYLYFRTLKKDELKKTLYPLLPILSMAIWVGLGLDFLSNLLIWQKDFIVTSQFLFVQTIIAIIILNGTLLSDRISHRLLAVVRSINPLPLSKKETILFGLFGSISISSWLTITFIDLFTFNLKYWQFFIPYLILILLAFMLHRLITKIKK